METKSPLKIIFLKMIDELTKLANKYGCDKGTTHRAKHGYTVHYFEKWKDIRYDVKNIFEIGINQGASLRMLRDFFPNATIYAIDVLPELIFQDDRIKTYVCNATEEADLDKILNGIDFDIILDDGGHNNVDQQVSLAYLFKHLKPGGMYIIEDLQTSLYEHLWGSSEFSKIDSLPPNHENVCLNMLKRFISNNEIVTPFISGEYKKYLDDNISDMEIRAVQTPRINLDIRIDDKHITSFIYKKN